MAAPMGFYAKNGLNVEVIKTAGWAVIRDKTINKDTTPPHAVADAAAITMGAGSNPLPYTMPAVENINGQAITLAVKHKDKRDPKDWKGFKFAFRSTIDAQLSAALLPRRSTASTRTSTVQIRRGAAPEMVANLRATISTDFWGPTR